MCQCTYGGDCPHGSKRDIPAAIACACALVLLVSFTSVIAFLLACVVADVVSRAV